ncbi:hypothetical protein HK405_011009, partial [Cladochytrium tenue]
MPTAASTTATATAATATRALASLGADALCKIVEHLDPGDHVELRRVSRAAYAAYGDGGVGRVLRSVRFAVRHLRRWLPDRLWVRLRDQVQAGESR